MRARSTLTAFVLAAVLGSCGPTTGSTETVEIQAAPDGTRWVGYGQVVVAVPEWWTTGETQCLAPVETTVYFDSGAQTDCAEPEPSAVEEVSALAALDGNSGYGAHLIGEMQSIGEVAGREVVELDGCEGWFEGVCRRVFAVPAEGVVFAVTIHDAADGDYTEIRDSLRILPEDQTTVPLATTDGWTPTWGAPPQTVDAVAEAVEAAGLDTEVVVARDSSSDTGLVADLPKGSLLDVQPAMGSVIDVGGTVTVTVSGGPGLETP